jgi:hypothetical protein
VDRLTRGVTGLAVSCLLTWAATVSGEERARAIDSVAGSKKVF